MKFILRLILLFISLQTFSQSKATLNLIAQISNADTVYFIADNSGCFHSYILEVKLCKQKSGKRKLIMKSDKGVEEHYLSSKNYQAFIKNYQNSVNHFSKESKILCTSIAEFGISGKTGKEKNNDVKFKNTSCEADFNPEMFLQNLIRSSENHKK